MKITEPTLLLDKGKCIANIDCMMAKAKKANVVFRPHFKTHQSHEIGKWFYEKGVRKITVSSLKMAEYFALDVWRDITVAFPTNILEIKRINELASKIQLNLAVESIEVMTYLASALVNKTGIFLKIDIGYHRTGIDPTNLTLLDKLLDTIKKHPLLDFKGFLGHAGHSYKAKGHQDIEKVHQESMEVIKSVKNHYIKEYPNLVISIGDTPTCSLMDDFGVADEIRPGNVVFYDLAQWRIGSCNLNQIAVALLCPVVAKHYERNEVVLYGGGVHFSKDRSLTPKGEEFYGFPVPLKVNGWGNPDFDVYMGSLSQEHGIIYANKGYLDSVKIGDLVAVLPIHSCMTANLMKSYHTFDGAVISRL